MYSLFNNVFSSIAAAYNFVITICGIIYMSVYFANGQCAIPSSEFCKVDRLWASYLGAWQILFCFVVYFTPILTVWVMGLLVCMNKKDIIVNKVPGNWYNPVDFLFILMSVIWPLWLVPATMLIVVTFPVWFGIYGMLQKAVWLEDILNPINK